MERLKTMERLSVENVSFSFGFKEILKDINFTLEKGKVVSIVGPSGGGKTTLLHLCAKLLTLEDGKIKNSFKSSSFAFQEARLLPWKNVIDNISLGLRAQNIKKAKADDLAKKIALKFGLEEDDFEKVYNSLKYPPRYLSLGRYEDLLDIERVDIVNIHQEDEVETKRDMYIPVNYGIDLGDKRGTIYNLTKEYEITKQGLRRWKKENGRVKAYYCSAKTSIGEGAYVDDFEKDAALIFC